ncbi:MAG: HAMP domain-containing protein [Leptolyngbyaceae cyanobacterium SM2_3_12]|nr:HAMP domain-containing protein [Leptolyngbyaceae cyanobacterium SM2_3_12]
MASLPQVPWITIASMDIAEIRAAGRANLVTFALLGLLLGGLAAVSTRAMARQLSAPLNELASKAAAVSQGNLDVRAESLGSPETQTLADSFNDLVLQVQSLLQEQTLSTRRATLGAEIAGAQVFTSAELLPVYDQMVTEVREILASDRVVIYQFNPDWSGRIVAESVGPKLPSAFKQQLGDPCIPPATLAKYQAEGLLLENNVATPPFTPST